MPTIIDRARVQRFMREGAQIVDVLPSEEFAEEHLPGAVNIPLKELDESSAARLRKDRPVVVYFHDLQ